MAILTAPQPVVAVAARASSGRAAAAVLAAAVLLGTSGAARGLLAPEAEGPGVAAVRLGVGAIGLVAYTVARRRVPTVTPLLRSWRIWLMGLAVAGSQATFFVAMAKTGVAVAVLISVGLGPVLAGLLGWAVGEGAPGWLWGGATAVAVAGLTLLVSGSMGASAPLGILAALASACCYATYTVVGVGLTRSGASGGAVVTAAFTIGALLLSPFLLTATWIAAPSGAALALWLGLGTITVAYLLFGVGLTTLQPGHITTLALLEPAVATALGALLLGERIGVAGVVGCVLVMGAVAVLGRAEQRSH